MSTNSICNISYFFEYIQPLVHNIAQTNGEQGRRREEGSLLHNDVSKILLRLPSKSLPWAPASQRQGTSSGILILNLLGLATGSEGDSKEPKLGDLYCSKAVSKCAAAPNALPLCIQYLGVCWFRLWLMCCVKLSITFSILHIISHSHSFA